ncbi:dethiobiotin synthase [Saccharothrix coeruleofusca]|uniref:ATP-dependent dethiobiotin synthetase BioD n=1 Tax=Saccharothrix coeruleofusca TaxID=33919 RepID=A0A918AKL8_9PSEU|nr:dethiobiotin synthase [Saccharothrix coeruleofusca]MBP2338335.1 dethiobiotin synthetase [Saccharothrix coeruleofusca]GGP49044.1 ATP-dependent dethiobiotin synthetase BioD [Saccharothrix coeruleofusca]
MSVLVITGTGTEVGKTAVVAALAAVAAAGGQRVAVLKPAQTGVAAHEPGDLAEVVRLAGPVTTRELRRYREPLAPATAARRAGEPPVRPQQVAAAAAELHRDHDLVLVEGAGGLLVRFDDEGSTIADAAWALNAPVLVVAQAGLGTLNTTALTAEALLRRGLESVGVVVGRWPAEPDLAARCNLVDLPEAAGAPLLGALPEGATALDRARFLEVATAALSPWFGGTFDPERFTEEHAAPHAHQPDQ